MIQYIIARNSLIPEAEKYANRAMGDKPLLTEETEAYRNQWNAIFHNRMNVLWKEKGENLLRQIKTRDI
jgi:hypothetical protein